MYKNWSTYNEEKAEEQYKKHLMKIRHAGKRRRERYKALGICTNAAKHGPAVEGKTMCENCLLENKVRVNRYRI